MAKYGLGETLASGIGSGIEKFLNKRMADEDEIREQNAKNAIEMAKENRARGFEREKMATEQGYGLDKMAIQAENASLARNEENIYGQQELGAKQKYGTSERLSTQEWQSRENELNRKAAMAKAAADSQTITEEEDPYKRSQAVRIVNFAKHAKTDQELSNYIESIGEDPADPLWQDLISQKPEKLPWYKPGGGAAIGDYLGKYSPLRLLPGLAYYGESNTNYDPEIVNEFSKKVRYSTKRKMSPETTVTTNTPAPAAPGVMQQAEAIQPPPTRAEIKTPPTKTVTDLPEEREIKVNGKIETYRLNKATGKYLLINTRQAK